MTASYLPCILLLVASAASLNAATQPRSTSASLYFFQQQRNSLFTAGRNADFESDTPALDARERLANDILMSAKRLELAAGHARPDLFPPARNFFDAKEDIRASAVFKIIRRMPKGAILHSHDSGMASIEYVVSLTYRENLWHCYDSQTQRIAHFLFAARRPELGPCDTEWIRTADDRQQQGAERFDAFVRTHFTLRTGHPFSDINDVWRHFNGLFGIVGPLVSYVPVWRDYYRQVLGEALADNVQYVEFRSVVPHLYELDGTAVTNETAIVQIFVDVLEEFCAENPTFIGSKMIYAPVRIVPDETLAGYVGVMTRLQRQFPKFVAGFDLVGQEDPGRSLLDVAEWLLKMPAAVKFYFHAGETNWYGSEVDENLYDAVALGTQRIGHGYALAKHPTLMQQMKLRGIAVEVNPISNQVLKLVSDLRNHPAATFFAQNMPLVISSDDPSFWEALPLSDDFYEAFMGIANARNDLRTLKKLALNSIKYSAMSFIEQLEAKRKWQAEWKLFIEDVIAGNL